MVALCVCDQPSNQIPDKIFIGVGLYEIQRNIANVVSPINLIPYSINCREEAVPYIKKNYYKY